MKLCEKCEYGTVDIDCFPCSDYFDDDRYVPIAAEEKRNWTKIIFWSLYLVIVIFLLVMIWSHL